MSSPPERYRIGTLASFIPLGEDTATALSSGRNRVLPHLISTRSASNFNDLHRLPPLTPTVSRNRASWISEDEEAQHLEEPWDGRRRSAAPPPALMTPQMRSQRLIGNANPRYRWEQYWKTEEELKKMRKPIRKYYERNNYLIQQYLCIDRLLDSSLPHNLIQEYSNNGANVPPTILEEPVSGVESGNVSGTGTPPEGNANGTHPKRVKRTARALYKVQDEETPLLNRQEDEDRQTAEQIMAQWEPDEDESSQSRTVTIAIYINLAANTILLALKIVVTILTSSVSVLASLVDAALDFLSTAIIWTTTYLIARSDQYKYPVGRRRLEPIGVLVFSIVMITSFVQVAIEGISHLTGEDHTIVQLTAPAIGIMAGTVGIKGLCWLYCRLIRNSSVQALAQDAMTDVVFNIFSIIFPLIGFYAKLWWLDPLGGIFLSLYVIFNWGRTSASHIKNLSGAAASADQRNVLLYLTMRFAKSIKQIQGLHAFHSGDFLHVEADIVLDENTPLRDSHDLGESLQYVLESHPIVDRCFVHIDYATWNLPTHLQQNDDD